MINNIEPFKERVLDASKPIEVYRCLNKRGHVYSVRQNQQVIGHATCLNIENVSFVVNRGGKKRAIQSGQRNVHAFIRGNLSNESLKANNPLKYCPFSEKGFMIEQQEVHSCNVVIIRPEGIFAD